VGKPVVLVGNQMERSFSLVIFWEKKEHLQRYFSLLGFIGIIDISPYHLPLHTSTMLLDEIRGLSVENSKSVPFGENSYWFSQQMAVLLPSDFVFGANIYLKMAFIWELGSI